MRYLILLLFVSAILAACGDPIGLPAAFISNRTDTVSLYALSGTPVTTPSGYSIVARQVIRTEQGFPFDFAFDIDSDGQAVFLPTGALKLGQQSGIQRSALDFDSIKIAPTGNYHLDSAQVVDVNSVLILHSQSVPCSFGGQAVDYAKLHVLDVDVDSTRTIKFEILTDLNCGYRGLEPGLPRH